jgi:hypothetical protein
MGLHYNDVSLMELDKIDEEKPKYIPPPGRKDYSNVWKTSTRGKGKGKSKAF